MKKQINSDTNKTQELTIDDLRQRYPLPVPTSEERDAEHQDKAESAKRKVKRG